MGFAGVRESFSLVDRVHAELEVGGVREEKKREKTHRSGGENGDAARRSVGGPRTGISVWGGALSPSRWCGGWS